MGCTVINLQEKAVAIRMRKTLRRYNTGIELGEWIAEMDDRLFQKGEWTRRELAALCRVSESEIVRGFYRVVSVDGMSKDEDGMQPYYKTQKLKALVELYKSGYRWCLKR